MEERQQPGSRAPEARAPIQWSTFVVARRLGAPAVWLQVNKRNERAIGAYLKAGFEIIGEAVFDIGGGFVMDDYLMAKAGGVLI